MADADDIRPGRRLLDPDGDEWVVVDREGDHANLRRLKDDLPFGVGSLSKLLAKGAFRLGADPDADAAAKARARHERRRGRG